MRNEFKTSIQLKRIDICDLIIACETTKELTNCNKWDTLKSELETQLAELDRQLDSLN